MHKSRFLVLIASFVSLTFLVGNVFASYTITDNANGIGSQISLEIPTREIYLKAGVWDVDNPSYFAHCYNGGNDYDVKLLPCETSGYYKFNVSIVYKNVVFVRDPSSAVSIDWDNLWNKSEDLTFDLTKDTYEITGWGSNKISTGQWINHSHDEKTSYSIVTAETVNDCAVKKETKYCGICSDILSETTFVDHEHLTEHSETAATCTTDGNIHYYSCDHCDKYFNDSDAQNEITDKTSVIVPQTGHSFTNHYDSDSTNHWLICDHDCGTTGTPEPHTFVSGVCSVCGYVQGHTHNYVNHPAVPASCTASGNAQYYTCTGCDHIFDANYQEISSVPTIAALGHNYVNHECSRCHDIESGWTKVLFEATKDTGNGNSLIIVGSFNGWSTTSNYVALSWNDGNVWKGEIFLENGTYEYKAVHHVPGEGKYFWEYDPNHSVTLSGGTKTIKWSPSINYS